MFYGEKLKYLREEKCYTQKQFGEILKINDDAYGQYEREYTIIPLKHLVTLCNELDVSIDYIFNFTKQKQYNNIEKKIDKQKAGQRLKIFRKSQNLTQTELAKILNTVQQVIGKYEKGINLISTLFLYDICQKYHISADYLLGRTDNEKI